MNLQQQGGSVRVSVADSRHKSKVQMQAQSLLLVPRDVQHNNMYAAAADRNAPPAHWCKA
jgi:hypothetical protein